MATVSTGQSVCSRVMLCSSARQMGHHSAQTCRATGWPGWRARQALSVVDSPVLSSRGRSGTGPDGTWRGCQRGGRGGRAAARGGGGAAAGGGGGGGRGWGGGGGGGGAPPGGLAR